MTQPARAEWNRPGKGLRSAVLRRGARVYLLASLCFLGCATLGGDPGQPLVPSRPVTRTGPFTVYSNLPLAPDAPAVRSLQSLERDLTATLGLRVDATEPPVEVYILRDREAFTHFLTFYFPELPPRRAFFIAQGPRCFVYTFYNGRLEEDLRHEATHALLHATAGDLPLWLDEGLAEYFEGPEDRQGLNPEHVARLPDDLKAGWKPDLARLETLQNVREMTPRDYRESWAWVHFLLNEPGPGKAVLLKYLESKHSTAGQDKAPSLSELLSKSEHPPAPQMLAHLEKVWSSPAPTAASPVAAKPRVGDSTVLFQNAGLETPGRVVPMPAAAPKRSLIGRFLGALGLAGRDPS